MRHRKQLRELIARYVLILAACIPYSIGIALFLNPNDLAPGGVTGISILINRLTGIETGSLIFVINVPVILLGMWKFGWKFILSTCYALVLITCMTNYLAHFKPLTDDRLLAAIVGSCLVAFGMGTIFKCRATTGGVDILVKLLRRRHPHMKTGSLFLMLDSVVIAAAGVVFGNIEDAIYASIAVVIHMFALDVVLYGRDGARLIYIISDAPEKITDRLLHEAAFGVTLLQGVGAYSSKEKRVIMCVAPKKQSLKVEEIVKSVDAKAFLIITSANEIYGEGYKSLFSEKL